MLTKNDRRQQPPTAYFKPNQEEDSGSDGVINNFRPRTPYELKLKRFLTSKQEDMDTCSVCPSIQKQLPDPSFFVKESQDRIKQQNLEKIVLTHQLKEEALAKAEAMINLLVQENNQYKNQISRLNSILSEKQQLIQLYSRELSELRQTSSQGYMKDLIKQSEDMAPKCVQNGGHKVKSKSQLFFQFTRAQKKQYSVYKSQNKVINADNLSFKDINSESNFSKKLSPYASRMNCKEEMESSTVKQIMGNISLLLVKEQMDGNKVLVEELMDIICQEEEEQEQLQMQQQRKEREFINEGMSIFNIVQPENVSKRLFTLQKQRPTDLLPINNSTSLISSYQKIIQDYKQYSAYLKAYLCECINYISEISNPDCHSQKSENSISQLLKMIAKDIKQKLNNKLHAVKKQNEQLKAIMEELIKNIQITHKQEESVEPWSSECGLNMKELQ